MGPDLYCGFTPGEIQIRVMPVLFGERANPINEGEGRGEVGESVTSLQVVRVHDFPIVVELSEQVCCCTRVQLGNAAFTRDAAAGGELGGVVGFGTVGHWVRVGEKARAAKGEFGIGERFRDLGAVSGLGSGSTTDLHRLSRLAGKCLGSALQ